MSNVDKLDPHADLYEGEDPPENEEDDVESDEAEDDSFGSYVGKRIGLFFEGVDDDEESLNAVIEAVISEGESRGLFFKWAATSQVPDDEVIVGSPMHQVMTGKVPLS